MTSSAINDFNQRFAQSPDFRQDIRQMDSLPQMLSVLEKWDCPLTGPELVTITNRAYQTWLHSLDPEIQPFFVEAHTNQALHQSIEACKNSDDVIRLAQSLGFDLSESDIKQAAIAAQKIEGFSFEKLWFKSLGL